MTLRSGDEGSPAASQLIVFPLSRVIPAMAVWAVVIAIGAAAVGVLLEGGTIGRAAKGGLLGMVVGVIAVGGGLAAVRVWEARASGQWARALLVAQVIALVGVAAGSLLLYWALQSAGIGALALALSAVGEFVGLQVVVARHFGRAVVEAAGAKAG